MSIPFASSEHFKNETMALSRHIKPMKVSALRLAMAKHAGFSSVQSYMANLDQQSVANSAMPVERTDSATFICRQGDVLVLQAKTNLEYADFDYIDDWNDMVEKELIGRTCVGLQEIGEQTINGETYVNGFLDITDEEVMDQIPEIIAHFCQVNTGPEWGGGDLAEQTLLKLLNAFFEVAQGERSPLNEAFEFAAGKPLALEHFLGPIKETRAAMNNLVDFSDVNLAVARQGFAEYDKDCAVKSAIAMGMPESIAESNRDLVLLGERTAVMLTTLITLVLEDEPGLYSTPKDFVCGLQDVIMSERGKRNRNLVKASFFTNQAYRMVDGQITDLAEGV